MYCYDIGRSRHRSQMGQGGGAQVPGALVFVSKFGTSLEPFTETLVPTYPRMILLLSYCSYLGAVRGLHQHDPERVDRRGDVYVLALLVDLVHDLRVVWLRRTTQTTAQ